MFPFDSVFVGSTKLTYKEWAKNIYNNFEKLYYISTESKNISEYHINKKYIKKKGIYKDVLNTSIKKQEFFMRPNACVGYVLAPELF